MEIRVLTERDVSPFRQLRQRALEENPESFLAHISDEKVLSPGEFAGKAFSWELPPTKFIVGAFIKGRLVGTCGFKRFLGKNVQHKGELWAVYVSPEGRGQGLGSALLNKCIQEAGGLAGLERILVYVADPQAKAFYEKFGFKSFGLEPNAKKVDGRYVNLEYMVRELGTGEHGRR